MGGMRNEILSRRGQAAAIHALIAAALSAALAPGCVEPENDGPEGLDAMMMPGLGVDAGIAVIPDTGVPPDTSVGVVQPAFDASTPRDAGVTPFDAATPPDAGGNTRT